MNTRPALAALLAGTLLVSCAVPGFVWKESKWEGPLTIGTARARLLEKCDMGPTGISDVISCERAFVDHRGRKVDVTDDVQKLLDDFMPNVLELKPWVKVDQPYGSRTAPTRGRMPYQLHIVTISPVVLLVVPSQADERYYGCGRWVVEGCLPSRRFDLSPYFYKRPPRVVDGSFWVAPALGVTSRAIGSSAAEVLIQLPDSTLRLTPTAGVWSIRRELRS